MANLLTRKRTSGWKFGILLVLAHKLRLSTLTMIQATQEIVTMVPQSTPEELKYASQCASEAFKTWRKTSVLTRQKVMLDLQLLIRTHMDEIAKSITTEQGKTLADAKGDVLRGLQVVEHACAIPTLQMGEFSDSITTDMDCYTLRQPLGVTAGTFSLTLTMLP